MEGIENDKTAEELDSNTPESSVGPEKLTEEESRIIQKWERAVRRTRNGEYIGDAVRMTPTGYLGIQLDEKGINIDDLLEKRQRIVDREKKPV